MIDPNPPAAVSLEQASAEVAAADAELISAVDRWRDAMVARLDQLGESLAIHIEETEGPGGLFESVMEDAPRLASDVRKLRDEHTELAARLAEAQAEALDDGLSENPHRVKGLHAAVHDLLWLIERHCHRSCRLAHDAVTVDIGGPVG